MKLKDRALRLGLPLGLVIVMCTMFALPGLAAPSSKASDKAADAAATAPGQVADDASAAEEPAPAEESEPAAAKAPARAPAKTTSAPGASKASPSGKAVGHGSETGTDSSGDNGQGDGPTSGDDGVNCDGSDNSDTGKGANQGGPYDNTCPTSGPAPNGNGGGKSTGKPCAGCVGNADDKNPPGQEPGPSDKNRGYECEYRDGHPWNKGIGKGNPAHTGCTEEPPVQTEDAEICHYDAATDAWSVITVDEADLQGHLDHGDSLYTGEPCDEEPPEEPEDPEDPRVLPKILRNPSTPKAKVLGTRIHNSNSGALPFTGAGLAPFVIVSLTLLGSGAAALRRARR